jgi:uncharacterized membrane protein
VDTDGRESRKDRVNPARKYIRLQEIGLAFFLSWPVAMMAADMYGLQYIIPIMSVLLIGVAVILFAIGHEGRQGLREQKRE